NAERPFRAPLVPLIPILGILTCLLLMFSLPAENWYRLIIWLVIGFNIYFGYGRYRSVMAEGKFDPPAKIVVLLAVLDGVVAGVATYMSSSSADRMKWGIVAALIGAAIGAGVGFLGYSRGKRVGPQAHARPRPSSLEHEIGTHGISPAGQAVADP